MTIWLDTPEVAEPPERLPRNVVHPVRHVSTFFRLYKLLATPGVWHKVAAGESHKLSAYSVAINANRGLPGKWEAVTRQGVLYVRYLGDNE